jgi:hypothetical protein
VGAAIILLSLPLDLFFQQIVSYPTISVVDTAANATISRTINYNPDDEVQWRGDDRNIHEDSQIMVYLYPFYQRTGSELLCLRQSDQYILTCLQSILHPKALVSSRPSVK